MGGPRVTAGITQKLPEYCPSWSPAQVCSVALQDWRGLSEASDEQKLGFREELYISMDIAGRLNALVRHSAPLLSDKICQTLLGLDHPESEICLSLRESVGGWGWRWGGSR